MRKAIPTTEGTPLSDALEANRRAMGQERSPAYGDALALCRRLERSALESPAPARVVEPVERNNPLSALAIRLLVGVGKVTQEDADQAFHAACHMVQDEARSANVTLPWVVAPFPPVAEKAKEVTINAAQIERAWRLGFRHACGAEIINADQEWGYKGANVIEEVEAITAQADAAVGAEGIRNAEAELICAEELLDSLSAHLDMAVTSFDCIGDYIKAVAEAIKRKAEAPVAEPVAPEFKTSEEGRAQVAQFFKERLRRHDFTDYIQNSLAADFACVIAPSLWRLMNLPARPRAPEEAKDAALLDWVIRDVFKGADRLIAALHDEEGFPIDFNKARHAIDAAMAQGGDEPAQEPTYGG